MIIDRKQAKWALSIAIAALFATLAYAIYVWRSANGPSGGSAMGIVFGSLGAGIFGFECLLSLRKRFRASRAGRVQTWLRAHLWLGLLSLPLVLMHSGFRWGSGLSAWLMWLVTIVLVSGVAGVGFQTYLPRRMKELVETETIFEQIPLVITRLCDEADDRIRLSKVEIATDAKDALHAHYLQKIRPYLTDRPPVSIRNRFATRELIKAYFDNLCTGVPAAVHGTLNDLQDICEERRQLEVQRRLHHWLHNWLLIHVPLSFALLALTVAHAVLSLRY